MAARTEGAAPDRPFVISRLFDAPRERVFRAWTEAEELKKWWGPKGFTVKACTMDLRPGGLFHYGLLTPDGAEMWGRWVLREVVPPERLVFIVSFSDEKAGVTRHPMAPEWPLETLSTIEFAAEGQKTRLTVTWIPWQATETERRVFAEGHDSMQQGWGGTLEQLGDYLAGA